jgi:hypothetical protein
VKGAECSSTVRNLWAVCCTVCLLGLVTAGCASVKRNEPFGRGSAGSRVTTLASSDTNSASAFVRPPDYIRRTGGFANGWRLSGYRASLPASEAAAVLALEIRTDADYSVPLPGVSASYSASNTAPVQVLLLVPFVLPREGTSGYELHPSSGCYSVIFKSHESKRVSAFLLWQEDDRWAVGLEGSPADVWAYRKMQALGMSADESSGRVWNAQRADGVRFLIVVRQDGSRWVSPVGARIPGTTSLLGGRVVTEGATFPIEALGWSQESR